MDTQAISLPGKGKDRLINYKPMEVKEIPILEPKLKQELKNLINEVLDERCLL